MLQPSVSEPNHPSVNFLKGIVRQQWASKLENSINDKQTSKQMITYIETHISNMNGIVDQLDYELFCIPHIISHSRNMTKEELFKYLRLVESIAVGYSSIYGRLITSLLMIGLTAKTKNLGSIEKYYRDVSGDIESKIIAYNNLIEKRHARIVRLSDIADRHSKGILKIFRRRRVAAIRRRIDRGRKCLDSLNKRMDSISDINRSMKLKAGFQ